MRIRLVDLRRERAWSPPVTWLDALERLAGPAGAPDWPVDLVLVDVERITELNRAWRRRDEATDVLSFSYLERRGPGRPDLAAGDRHAARDLWRAPEEAAADAAVGEIVLAPAFIVDGCARGARPVADELALLTVHGVLHVLGWEHGEAAGARAMRAHETELLLGGGFRHPLPAAGEED